MGKFYIYYIHVQTYNISCGHSTPLIESSELKPDVKYSAKIGYIIFDPSVFEVKCPNSVTKHDLYKVSLELQHTINLMIIKKKNLLLCTEL